MKWTWEKMVSLFEREGYPYLKGSKHGLEKECLRVDKNGLLAKTPHPKALGSPLTNPYISTDFSEAQLELITPAFQTEEMALRFLHQLHTFIYLKLEEEWLWPFSTPGKLPEESEIPLAQYGTSNRGMEKFIYRQGLSHRYGRKMQTLSGIHYNFSFSSEFWSFLHARFGKKEDITTFISESYLHIARNFLRYGWLNTFLFGASPAVDQSYLREVEKPLVTLPPHTVYAPLGTSIRMSHLGYHNKQKLQQMISYNSLPEYLSDLKEAISTPYPPFKKFGTSQLNDHMLQMEAEHYSPIRPKPHLNKYERPLFALGREGIAYIEVRSVDINPYNEIGITLDQLYFLHLFLIYCLFKPSPPLTREEEIANAQNREKVALYGQDLKLKLKNEGQPISLNSWGLSIFEDLLPIASMFGSGKYLFSLERQKEKLFAPELLLASQIVADLKESRSSFVKYGLYLAEHYKLACLKEPLKAHFLEKMEQMTFQSLEDQKTEEMVDDRSLKGYECLETSTQALIREAKNRGIEVEVLDWSDNLIRLRKGEKMEFVKQASRTVKDSLISYHLMENKQVTKHILEEFDLPVPKGFLFSTLDEALREYRGLAKKQLVVKPNATNYGIGVSFIPPQSEQAYAEALREAFRHGGKVIVEEFCKGEEYRFLVVGNKVVAVCQRVPANVVGDGVHTLTQLVRRKNKNPRYFRKFSPLKLGKVEKDYLQVQGLTVDSIPDKDKKVFLRQNSNVSTGGESIDYTDRVHKGYSEIALLAAKSVNAAICGVDMIVEHIEDPPFEGKHFILELNFNPALYLHRYPVEGKTRYVEKDILDFLGF